MKKLFVFCFLLLVFISFAGCSKDEITILENKIAELEEKLELLETENSTLKAEKESVQNELDSLKTDYESLKAELNLISYDVIIYDIDGEVLGNEKIKSKKEDKLFDQMKIKFDIDYDDGEWGVYLNSINGSICDNNYYIAIYENGTLASTGIEGLILDNNDLFEFKVECWNTIESGYGVLDSYDVLVDKIIYSYAKNYMPEILNNINSYDSSNHWDYLYLNTMIKNGYDSSIFNASYFNESIKESLNIDVNSLSGANFGKYYYLARLLDKDLSEFKTAYQTYINNDLGSYSEWVAPFSTSLAKSLDITSENLEALLNTDYKAGLEWGVDGRCYQICNLALFGKCDKTVLEEFAGKVDFDNGTSNALVLIVYAALGENIRDPKYEIDGKDVIENLIDNYYDEELGLVKVYPTDTGLNFSTNQLYAGLMAYKVSRDFNKVVNILE